jgi:hypothetical protein
MTLGSNQNDISTGLRVPIGMLTQAISRRNNELPTCAQPALTGRHE